jgi:hypothetical protein
MASTKSNAEKLLVKPGSALMVMNQPVDFEGILGPLPAGVSLRRFGGGNSDVIVYFARSQSDLESQLPEVKPLLEPGGIIWVAYRKGTSKLKTDVNRDTIWRYAKTVGLESVALVSLDDDWSAMRLKLVP